MIKIRFRNMRMRCGREGIEFYPPPTVQCVFNEYGERFRPKWQIRLWWIWFCLMISSAKQEEWKNTNKKEKNDGD